MATNATLNTLTEKRGQLLSEAQRIALGEKNAENRTKLAAMLADVEKIEEDIEQEQRLASLVSKYNEPASPAIRQNPGSGITLNAEQRKAGARKAIREYMATGQVTGENRQFARFDSGNETRDIGADGIQGSITTNGGLMIGTEFDSLLHAAQKSYGEIASAVRTYVTGTGAPIRVAGIDPTSLTFTEIAEDTAVSENDPAIVGLTSNTSILTGGKVLVSLAEITDSEFDVESVIQNSFAQAYWRGISNYVVNGSPSSNFASLLSGISNTVTSASPTTFAWGDFTSLLGAIDPAYLATSKFALNSVSRAAVLGIVDANQRPILNINAASIDGVDTLLGRPVIYATQLPNAAASASGTVLLADFAATYTLRQVRGSFGIVRLDQRWMDQLMIGFVAYARGGGYLNPLNGAKSAVKLVQHSSSITR